MNVNNLIKQESDEITSICNLIPLSELLTPIFDRWDIRKQPKPIYKRGAYRIEYMCVNGSYYAYIYIYNNTEDRKLYDVYINENWIFTDDINGVVNYFNTSNKFEIIVYNNIRD